MSEVKPLLSLVDVTRHYATGEAVVKALDGVSIEIWPGEFLAIMGQSGSGKSTLMNILGCLDRPSGGTYHVGGTDVASLDADALAGLRRDMFGFIFQRYNLLANVTAEENVEIPAIYAGLAKDERAARAKELLGSLGMGARGGHLPPELSGGQQQRVAIARALMNNAPVILADEPTGALDSKSGVEVMRLLHELHAAGRTIILITHDEKVAAAAHRVIRIQDGVITEDDGPARGEHVAARGVQQPAQHGRLSAMSDISEAAKMALRSLKVNLFRTALTLLGIVIGVASVIIMLAVGNGSKQDVLNKISAMGTNILSIRPGAPGIRSSGDIVTLVPEDAAAVMQVPNVTVANPERSGRYTVRYGNLDYATAVQGVGPLFPNVRDWPVQSGGFFTERDVAGYAPVALLGETVRKNLFPQDSNPVGEYIQIKNVPFQIIGIMGAKGASGFGTDQDDAVFIPYTTGIIRLFGKPYLASMSVKVADVGRIDETQEAITALLKTRHHTEDFNIRNSASILATATETQNTLTVLLGAVAAISLLVGGIGVMNIMLVSVTERTREIGIRMATGARMRDIMLQFNTESAVVCTVGGVMGVLIGFGGGFLLQYFDVSVQFSAGPAVLAFLCAVLTGFIFGYLPARKAARLDPVVALASE